MNMVALPLFLAYTDLNAYVVQAGFAVFAVVAGYLGNKYFTFRKRGDGTDGDQSVAEAERAVPSGADGTDQHR